MVAVVLALVGVLLIVGGVVVLLSAREGGVDILVLFLGFASVVVANILAIVKHSPVAKKDEEQIPDIVTTPPEGIGRL